MQGCSRSELICPELCRACCRADGGQHGAGGATLVRAGVARPHGGLLGGQPLLAPILPHPRRPARKNHRRRSRHLSGHAMDWNATSRVPGAHATAYLPPPTKWVGGEIVGCRIDGSSGALMDLLAVFAACRIGCWGPAAVCELAQGDNDKSVCPGWGTRADQDKGSLWAPPQPRLWTLLFLFFLFIYISFSGEQDCTSF